MSYNPTFNRPIKGKFQDDTSFVSIVGGSDAYLLEDEVNEMQWIQINSRNDFINSLYTNGYIKEDNINHIRSSGQNDNTFYVDDFKVNINGFLGKIYNYKNNNTNNYHSIQLPLSEEDRYDFIFLEVCLKILNETTTEINKYGGVENSLINYEVFDSRISLPTSRRIQLQWKLSTELNINYIVGEQIFDNNDNNIYSQLLKGTPIISNYSNNLWYAISDSENDNDVIDKIVFIIPLFVVRRYANKTIINTQDITDLRPEAELKNSTNKSEISDILMRISTLEQRMNNLSTEVLSDQKAYGLSMNKKTGIFTGADNIANGGTTITIDNYSVAENNFVVALTNLGTQYGGQIGEVWCWKENDRYHVCNSGDENILFNAFDFRDDNPEIAILNITSNGLNGRNITYNADNPDITLPGDIKECLIYIVPMYDSDPMNSSTEIPSIGDIFISYDDDNIYVYNTGAVGIPLQLFALHIDESGAENKNLELISLPLNEDTLVTDAFGRHHIKIYQDTTWGNCNILLGTPILFGFETEEDKQNNFINLGEIYIEQNKDVFMLTTTSYGNATLNFVVFKTAYTSGNEEEI